MMLRTPVIKSSTPAKTHQPLIRLSSFIFNPSLVRPQFVLFVPLEWFGISDLPPLPYVTICTVRGKRGQGATGWLVGMVILTLVAPTGASAAGIKVVELGGHARRPADAVGASASSIRVADFSGEGLRTNGRIFGFDPREGAYSCSGTALNTPSRSIVLTAGHCVLEAGSAGKDLVFIPAYD